VPTGPARFELYAVGPDRLYVNFGFWDVIRDRGLPDGYHKRLVEQKVAELSGIKSLDSDSYFREAEFRDVYNKPLYDALKARYDPSAALKDLSRKCILRE
jgi:hypothetical protein